MTTETRPVLYVARMDVRPEFLERFEDWYERKHAVDLIEAGFHSCAAYHAVIGAPLVQNVYEVGGVDIFGGDRYRSARTEERDPERPLVLENVSSRSNVPYVQEYVLDAPGSDGDLHQSWIATLQLDISEGSGSAALADWAGAVGRELVGLGATAVRLCRRDGVHPANPSPDILPWMLFAALPALPDAPSDRDDPGAALFGASEVGWLRSEALASGLVTQEGAIVVARRRFAVRAL